ncbi:PLP-dependent aminotransferase family protein [Pseudomonas sp. HR96]|uniref:aminotransferase-like domain-containing protein n=1 Tax=Pseudomonas sp. HR96 TaxID=1027966 RepID=UPI002A74DF53|nr:PLP-dependent aminotransferase family protein [Pseudomonas sp. HR96]WPP01373.1 PLP-dependent aminotransferase family protein [Pseudomonas sp. HR96]
MPDYRFSSAFQAPTGSVIRELFKYLSLPGMISFAGGYPAAQFFDRTALAAASAQAFAEAPLDCLQYAATEGLPALREQLSLLMGRRGAQVSMDQVLVTTGSQQGLDLLIKVLLEPGDTVLVERPGYPAALQALRMAGARVLSAVTDRDGLDTERLAAQLAALAPGTVRLLYCVPTFANPTGACLPLARREQLLALAARHDLLIVEDDPYGALRFSGQALPSLLELSQRSDDAQGRVVHLSSLSKVIAPGLRLGWMVAPDAINQRCRIAKQTVDLCTSPWAQQIAAEYLRGGALEVALPGLLAGYRDKCQRMLTGLAELEEYIEISPPAGGMFIWGKCRQGVSAQALLEQAIERRVLFVPGAAFYAEAPELDSLRLSFAAPDLQQIDTGLERLGEAFKRL